MHGLVNEVRRETKEGRESVYLDKKKRKRKQKGEERIQGLGMFSQMRGDTMRVLPARKFIDDKIRNRCDLPPRYVPSIIYK